jgi:hypothetical protein
MIISFMVDSNFKLKASHIGFRISHLDACTSMEHGHLSYAYIILHK